MTSPETSKIGTAGHPENDADPVVDADLRGHTDYEEDDDPNELRPQNDSSQEMTSLIFGAIFLGLSGVCAVFFL